MVTKNALPTVLVVDDDADVRALLSYHLGQAGYAVFEAHDGVGALNTLESREPDVILLDINMPNMGGFEVLEQLRQNGTAEHVPIIVLSDDASNTNLVRALVMGAHDYLRKSFVESELLARVGAAMRMKSLLDELAKKNYQLELTSRTDPLTGLYNRRHLDEQLELFCANAIRYEQDLAVVILDIDYFKKVNDTYGHHAGDVVITEVAKIMQDSLRKGDLAARWGGEEFLILLPHTSLEGARIFAERLRKRISSEKINVGKADLEITASFGCASGTDEMQVVARADDALYEAKNLGRNRVMPEI